MAPETEGATAVADETQAAQVAEVAEKATTEQEPTADAGIAKDDADARPEPEAETEEKAEVEGESQSGESEGTGEAVAGFWKSLTPEEFDAILEQAPAELRESSGFLKEQGRRAEQKGRNQAGDELKKLGERRTANQEVETAGLTAARSLKDTFDTFEDVLPRLVKARKEEDEEATAKHTDTLIAILESDNFPNSIEAYAQLHRGRGLDTASTGLRTVAQKHMALLEGASEEQKQAIKSDADLFDLLIAQAERRGEASGVTKGEAKPEAAAKMASVIERLAEARKGGNTKNPTGAAGTGETDDERLERVMVGTDRREGDQQWWNQKYGRDKDRRR